MMRNQRNGGIGLWLLFPVPSCIVAWIVAVLTLASLQLVEGLAPPPATTRAIVSKHQQHPHSRRTSSPPLRSTTRGLSITLLLRQAATSNSPDPVTPSSSVKEGTMATAVLSWADLVGAVGSTSVGRALNDEEALRITGRGAGAHRRNTLRLFDRPEDEGLPDLVLYRDHAGWCVLQNDGFREFGAIEESPPCLTVPYFPLSYPAVSLSVFRCPYWYVNCRTSRSQALTASRRTALARAPTPTHVSHPTCLLLLRLYATRYITPPHPVKRLCC